MAAVVFFVIVKLLGALIKRASPAAPSEPITKECPNACRLFPSKRSNARMPADLV